MGLGKLEAGKEPEEPLSGAATVAAAAEARSEIADYIDRSNERRRLFPRAALVGLAAGILAVVFRGLLAGGDSLRSQLLTWSQHAPVLGWMASVALGVAGALVSVVLVRRYAPEASGSGIPHLEAVLHRHRELRWTRVLPVKFVGGVVALGSGLALGREGPTVQMGGAVGQAIGQRLGSSTRERLTLVAAGGGAGLAAAFNAPLAGLVFVLEELQRDFRPAVFGAAFIAAAVADIVSRVVAGQLPVFLVPSYAPPPLAGLPAFVVLGLLAGLLGVAFNRGLLATLNGFARLRRRTFWLAVTSVGAIIGTAAWFDPALVGGGHALVEHVLDGQMALIAIPLYFLVRFVLTLGSYGTGAPGGIFAPLLVLGALLGLGVGEVAHNLAPAAVPEVGTLAVVGMAAYFTAIVRAPLTGVVLIAEMTASYNLMLPLLVACFCAYVVAEYLQNLPIYEALLARDLQRGTTPIHLTAPTVLELEVAPDAPFVGKRVRELGLPPGCVLVRLHDGGREWVPTAETMLYPHLRLVAVIAPEAAEGMALLRFGCAPPDDGATFVHA